MGMVFMSNLGNLVYSRAVFLHMIAACVTKELGSHWCFDHSSQFNVLDHELLKWVGSVVEETLERAGEHLLKSEGHHAVGRSSLNSSCCQVESCASSAAVVIHIDDWNARASELIYSALAGGGVSVDITYVCLLHCLPLDASITQRTTRSLFSQLVVIVVMLSGLVEFSHSISNDKNAWLLAVYHIYVNIERK